MSEAPKLFVNKPKKAQLKQSQASATPSPSSSAAAASSSTATSMGASASAAPPPQPPKESFARRYKFLWPLLLAVNFSIGAYLFVRTKKKDVVAEEGVDDTTVTTTAVAVPVTEEPVIPPPIIEPMKIREPIPEYQQRELFKWLLEEKRKIKPRDQEERKRIDEEKAILKQFIRAKSIPTL